jgi:DNA-binding NarL/FixJ family response regulator
VIRVLLIDDHASAREPLAFMLDREPDLTVVASTGSIAESRQVLADGAAIDVALVDLGLPDGWGTELLGSIYASNPRAVALVLTSHTDRVLHARALAEGAAGVVHKSADVAEIASAIRRLHAGEPLVSPREVADAVALAAADRRERDSAAHLLAQLTPREHDVLQTLAEGLPDKEIAARLSIGVGTVRTHVNSILTKLGVSSRLQAVVLAARNGAIAMAAPDPSGPIGPI